MDVIPYRDSYWNVPVWLRVIMFAFMAVAVAIMVRGIWQRVRLWREGQPAVGFDRPGARLARTFRYAVAQTRVARQSYPAVMHLSIFGGMVLLFVGTVLATIDTDIFEFLLDSKLLKGNLYLIYKLVLDLATLFGFIGLALAVYRRYVVKPARLNTDWRYNLTFPLLAFILLTGLLVEAFRLAAVQPEWGPWSVIGYPISLLLRGLGENTLLLTHRALWSVHFLGVAALIAVLPRTNLLHIITSPANIYAAPFRERGALYPISDLETAERWGASRLADFPWPRLVNLDACTECGRCQEACPAYMAGQPLNPKQLVLDLQHYLAESGLKLLGESQKDGNGQERTMVGDVIRPETLWACTTCYACVYECPVLIEQVDDIVDMRRYLALMEGDLPSSLATTLTNIERSGNPWKQPRRKRTDWTQGLDFEVPVMADVGEADVLWWVGCAGAYDPRNQKVSRAVARILHTAGVNFAILGEEEQCTGDAARRAGNEYLFETLAKANIETMGQYTFKLILTQCPHCYNTLLHEYPQFGAHYQVMHHTQYIEALIVEENITVRRNGAGTVTIHDPCYLGRYNDEYDAPRTVAAATGKTLVEMERSRDRAMCCGGGGARVWMEDDSEVRVNRNRLEQIIETGAGEAAVACPFCMIMLEDARGAVGAENLVIRDVAEVVAEALISSEGKSG